MNSIFNVTVFVLIAKTVAFVKEFVLSYYFGVSSVTDAYSIAYTIPITILSLVAVGINSSYIPIYSQVLRDHDEKEANKFSNSVLSLVFWLSLLFFIIIFIFTGPIIKVFAGGFSDSTVDLTIKLTRYLSVAVFFLGYINVMSAYVQVKNKYFVVPVCEVLLYGLSIVGIIAGALFRLEFLSIGVLLGYITESIVFTFTAYRCKYHFSFHLFPKSEYLSDFLRLVLPVIVGSIASDINKIVDKTLASYAMEGGISILNYAHKIDDAVISIIVSSLVAVAYPQIAKAVSSKKMEDVQIVIEKDICYLLLLMLPIFFGIMFYSKEIVNLLFHRGAFTSNDVLNVSTALIIYATGLIPTALRKYTVRIYYSFSDSKIPATNAIIVIGINIVLSILFSFVWGIYGIALGSTLSVLFGYVILSIKLKKHIVLDLRPIINPCIKIIAACILMAGISKIVYITLSSNLNENISFVLSLVVAIVIYFVMIKVLGLFHLLKNAFSRGNKK